MTHPRTGSCRASAAQARPPFRSPGAYPARIAIQWLLVALLVFQLFALTRHNHDISVHADDCPSCMLALHFSSSGTAAPPALPTQWLTVGWPIPQAAHLVTPFTPPAAFLLPPALAPPAVVHFR